MNKIAIEDKILAFFEGEATLESIQGLLSESQEAKDIYADYQLIYNDLDFIVEEDLSIAAKAKFSTWLERQASQKDEEKGKVVAFNYKRYLSIAAVVFAILASVQFMMNKKTEQLKFALDQEIRHMMEDKSSSERIKAINISANIEGDNDENKIVALLIYSLENDKSSNVRLAAVEALADFVVVADARSALITSLAKEKDGAVKVAAINALSNFNNADLKETFEKVTQDKSNDRFVIDEAHIKLLSLDQH